MHCRHWPRRIACSSCTSAKSESTVSVRCVHASWLCKLAHTVPCFSLAFLSAISLLHTLPAPYVESHFATILLARCHFELHAYADCCTSYAHSRTLSPGGENLVGLEYYSTALWHRKESSVLASLAQQLALHDRCSPEANMALGNAFSLARDSSGALKFFRRAIQVSAGRSAYAYVLAAHEYMAAEEFERAVAGYRLSLRADPRCYTAWYGLGNVYVRQEKYAMAVYHFKRALQLNPGSSVLHSYLGMTLHSARRFDDALAAFRAAAALEPRSPLPRFQMAHVLTASGRLDEAIEQLKMLAHIVPREANVHFLMGKILKKKGNVRRKQEKTSWDQSACELMQPWSITAHSLFSLLFPLVQLPLAMHHLVCALDLDPKDRTLIKAAIDNLHSQAIDDEEEEIC